MSYICLGVIFLRFKRWVVGLICLALIVCSVFVWGRETTIRSAGDDEKILPIIILDAGHGGIDSGTSGADGTEEKGLNLSIAMKTKEILTAFGFSVVMTRTEDDLISDPTLPTIRERKRTDLQKRLAMTEQNQPCVLLSIHQNYYTDGRYSGAQVFFSTNHDDSRLLAECFQKTIIERLQPQNTRKIKASGKDIYLLYQCKCPAVMVECGFMSNAKELSLLKNEKYQTKLAFTLALSLLAFYTE